MHNVNSILTFENKSQVLTYAILQSFCFCVYFESVMDKKGNSSHHNQKDVDNNKIGDYMRINKEMGKLLSSKNLKIANLENLLRISETENKNLQMECQTWKSKFIHIRKIYIEHVHGLQAITSRLRAENNINNPNDDERDSSESIQNRPGRSNEFQDLHTIDEADEIENSVEGSAEQKDHNDEDEHDANVNGSEVDGNTDVNNEVSAQEGKVDPGIPTVVENDNASKNGAEMGIEEIRKRCAEEDKSSSIGHISLLTANCGTTVDTSISTDTINGNCHSVSNVRNGSTKPSLKKLPAIKSTIKSNSLEHVSMENQTIGNKKAQSLVSSTPNGHKEASVSKSNVVVTSMTLQSSTTSVNSRPKRKAAPGSLCEPKLNTKLKRRE